MAIRFLRLVNVINTSLKSFNYPSISIVYVQRLIAPKKVLTLGIHFGRVSNCCEIIAGVLIPEKMQAMGSLFVLAVFGILHMVSDLLSPSSSPWLPSICLLCYLFGFSWLSMHMCHFHTSESITALLQVSGSLVNPRAPHGFVPQEKSGYQLLNARYDVTSLQSSDNMKTR